MNLDEFRRTLDQIAGPEPEPSPTARAKVRQRSRRKRQRKLVTAGVLIVAVLATVVVASRERANRSGHVQISAGGGAAAAANSGGVFPDTTGLTLILDDGASGIIAVDLDNRSAQRRPTPGGSTPEQPIGIVGGDRAFVTGSNDVYAVPFDGHPAVRLGHADEFTRAAEPNDVWLISWPGGRQGSGTPVSLREVDMSGHVIRRATNGDPDLGAPEMGIPGGIAYESRAGVALWDAATEKVTARLGTGTAFVDDVHNNVLAWCENLCTTEHITQLGARDLTISAPTNSGSFTGRAARFSPDGRYLAAIAEPSGPVTNNARSEIVLIDAHTGASRVITPDTHGPGVSLAWSPDSRRLFFSPFADANTHITLGEYNLSTEQLHTAIVPFWGYLSLAAAQSTAAPLFTTPPTDQNACPPPAQASGGPTPACAFLFSPMQGASGSKRP